MGVSEAGAANVKDVDVLTDGLIVRGKGKKIDRPCLAVLPHKRFRSIWRRAIPSESFAAWPRRGDEPSQRRSLLRDNHKLIANLWGDVALHDLKSDPMEVINLADKEPALRQKLTSMLAEWLACNMSAGEADPTDVCHELMKKASGGKKPRPQRVPI